MGYLLGLWASAAIGFLIGAVWCGTKMRDRFLEAGEFDEYPESASSDN